jgi:hypothetical protein
MRLMSSMKESSSWIRPRTRPQRLYKIYPADSIIFGSDVSIPYRTQARNCSCLLINAIRLFADANTFVRAWNEIFADFSSEKHSASSKRDHFSTMTRFVVSYTARVLITSSNANR